MRKNTLCVLLVLLSPLVSGLESKNQQQEQQQEQLAADDKTIIVIATRTDSDAHLHIGNVDKISVEEISQVAHVHIQELLQRIPGVNLQRGNGQEYLPAIRSPVLTGAGACGGFLITEDNIPLRAAGFCNVNELFEAHTEQAQSIEVVRGPGSAFYGSNALHGIININTPDVPASPRASLGIEIGSDDFSRFKAQVGSRNTDSDNLTSGYNLALTVAHDGGYRNDSGYEQQKLSGRHLYSTKDLVVNSGISLTHLNQQTAGFVLGADSYRNSAVARSNPNPEAFRKAESLRIWSRFEVPLGDISNSATQSKIIFTPYVRLTDMTFRMHFLPGKPLEENGQKSLGFQLGYYSKLSNKLAWSIGLDSEISDGFLKQTQINPTEGSAFLQATIPIGKHYDYQVDATLVAPFLHLDWQFLEQWKITAGIRYENLSYDYRNNMLSGRSREDGTECGFGGCRYSRPNDRKDEFSNWSPKLGVGYQLDNNSQVFANLAQGFRAPQATELYRLQRSQSVADLKSVELDSFELGFRKYHRQLSYEMVIFLMKKNNVIFRDSNFFNLSNGQTKHRGVEARIDYLINDSFNFSINGSLATHQYVSDQLLGEININGNDIDTAPKRFGSAQLQWAVSDSLNTELEWVHQGGYFTDAENLHKYEGHDLINLRVNWETDHDWQVFARIDNLLNKKYATRADYTFFTEERYFPGVRRSFFVGVQWRQDQ
ncbi:MAG: TonB-dependent receptor [Kangiella sp.]|nr:MAG: TonB-dependent receptor [Kangiella sp.]